MKYLIRLLVLVSPIAFLSGQELAVVEVESNKIISLDATQSWNIVRDWTKLNELAPQAVKSTIVDGLGLNSTWKIELLNGGSITEKMVYYDPANRIMSYIMTETPMPVENYMATIKVEPYGVMKSLVSFYTTCKTHYDRADEIKCHFKGFQATYLSNLETQRNE